MDLTFIALDQPDNNVLLDEDVFSGRQTSMSEYGNMICALGYLKRNSHKPNLYLIIE